MQAILYIEVLMGVLLGTGICARIGLDAFAMVLIPVPVALYWATGAPGRSLIVVACAILGAWIGAGTLADAAIYNLAAAVGVLLGWGMKRRWTFGWCVTMATAVVFTAVALNLWVNWDTSISDLNQKFDTLEALAENSSNNQNSELTEVFAEARRLVLKNWNYIAFSAYFQSTLFGVTLFVAFLAKMLRLMGAHAGPSSTFRSMRLPDTLVWLAIALGILVIIDHWWPNETLRVIAWNGGLGLQCVYWLSGFAILLYTLYAFKVNRFMCGLTISFFLVFSQGIASPLCLLGLFDTWWDFRTRIDRLIEARRTKEC